MFHIPGVIVGALNVGFYIRDLTHYASSSDGMIVSCKLVKDGKEEVVAHFKVRIARHYSEKP
jgi:hypothetical protein